MALTEGPGEFGRAAAVWLKPWDGGRRRRADRRAGGDAENKQRTGGKWHLGGVVAEEWYEALPCRGLARSEILPQRRLAACRCGGVSGTLRNSKAVCTAGTSARLPQNLSKLELAIRPSYPGTPTVAAPHSASTASRAWWARRQRPEHGLRQHGRRLGYGRGLHPRNPRPATTSSTASSSSTRRARTRGRGIRTP